MQHETNTAKVVARLRSEGWTELGGSKHAKFVDADNARTIIVPRHRTLSVGVARSIAKQAGWTK